MKAIFITNEKRTHLFNHVLQKWDTIENADGISLAYIHYYACHTMQGALAAISYAKKSPYGVAEGKLGHDWEYVICEKEIAVSSLL